MGQIFSAIAIDRSSKPAQVFVYDADKFHANCYSFSEVTRCLHRLLRKGPHLTVYGGHYAVEKIQNETFFASLTEEQKQIYALFCFDEVLEPYKNAFAVMEWETPEPVRYEDYLVNHNKKEAVDLKAYYEKSVVQNYRDGVQYCIDLIPCLTETGDGLDMALYDGQTPETTRLLDGKWAFDTLQIVDTLPEGYTLIDCCFAGIKEKAFYYYPRFGTDSDGRVLREDGKVFAYHSYNPITKHYGTKDGHVFIIPDGKGKVEIKWMGW